MFTVEDKRLAGGRRVWVYTPQNYDSKSKSPCKLLLCFVGLDYVGEISLPTILDNLIASDRIPGARHDPVHWRAQLAEGLLYLTGRGRQTGKY